MMTGPARFHALPRLVKDHPILHMDDDTADVAEMATLFNQLAGIHNLISLVPSPRGNLHRRTRRLFRAPTDAMTDMEFRKAFRMNRTLFKTRVEILRPCLERNENMGELRNGIVEPDVRIAIVLRIMSGASYHDLMSLWGIASTTIYDAFHDTMSKILAQFPFDDFPAEVSQCVTLAKAFVCSHRHMNPLPGCICTLDGIAVCIRKPALCDCTNPAQYFHRKGYFAIPVQAICD